MPWPKGKKKSPETVAKLRESLARPEVKAKMSEKARSRVLSDEHRARISERLQGHEVSEETRAKLREAHTGKIISTEQREKTSETMKARWEDPEYRARQSRSHAGNPSPMAGKKHTAETRERLRHSHIGIGRTLESRLKQGRAISGVNHYNWRGGPLASNHRGAGWHTIKRMVRERADGACEFCGGESPRGWQLDVHHVVPYREIPISADWACLALCRSCHVKAERGVIDTSELQETLRPRLEALLGE